MLEIIANVISAVSCIIMAVLGLCIIAVNGADMEKSWLFVAILAIAVGTGCTPYYIKKSRLALKAWKDGGEAGGKQ